MRRAWIVLMLALPAGCGEDPPPTVVNQAGADRPAEAVVTPIADEAAKADSESDRPAPVPRKRQRSRPRQTLGFT